MPISSPIEWEVPVHDDLLDSVALEVEVQAVQRGCRAFRVPVNYGLHLEWWEVLNQRAGNIEIRGCGGKNAGSGRENFVAKLGLPVDRKPWSCGPALRAKLLGCGSRNRVRRAVQVREQHAEPAESLSH
jgi:hypothetical protein